MYGTAIIKSLPQTLAVEGARGTAPVGDEDVVDVRGSDSQHLEVRGQAALVGDESATARVEEDIEALVLEQPHDCL